VPEKGLVVTADGACGDGERLQGKSTRDRKDRERAPVAEKVQGLEKRLARTGKRNSP
jgi:hypothetical protein